MTGSHDDITEAIIGAAIDVHGEVGPGLLESAYEACIVHELVQREFEVQRQLALPVRYKGLQIDCGFRIDLLVAKMVIVELKCVERILRVHEAQLLSYLRMADLQIGLLINFHGDRLRDGIKRLVNNLKE